MLNVAGHVRLQDALWVEQLDMHASEEAAANLNLLVRIAPLFAMAVLSSAPRMTVAKVNFTVRLLSALSTGLCLSVKCKNELASSRARGETSLPPPAREAAPRIIMSQRGFTNDSSSAPMS